MRAGILRETITIQQPVTVQNEYGANGVEWKDVISTRAKAIYNAGNR